jgi:outer membrane protein assembly factor BamB
VSFQRTGANVTRLTEPRAAKVGVSQGEWMRGVMPSVIIVLVLLGFVRAGPLTEQRLDEKTSVSGSEWPGWGGPDRNFTSNSTGLASRWPASGPPVVWSRPLGAGHSSIIVDGNRLYTMYRPPPTLPDEWADEEVIIALDAISGETAWEYRFQSSLETMNFSYGAGPHATPLIVDARVFAVSTDKQLFALDKNTGRELWSHNLVEEFGAPPNQMRFAVMPGYAPSPIAYRDTVIVMVGGEKQGVMAFAQETGEVKWRGGDFPDSITPASPIVIGVDGQTQLVVMSGDGVHGLDPATGSMLWSFAFPTEMGVNITTPLWDSEHHRLFLTAALDGGTRALELRRSGTETEVKELWFTTRMRVHHSNVVQFGDYYYGSSGDLGPSFLTAINGRTGQIAWRERAIVKSNFLRIGNQVILLDEDGRLALARFTPEGADVISEVQVTTTPSWTVPTLVGSMLYVRDQANIMALDLSEE